MGLLQRAVTNAARSRWLSAYGQTLSRSLPIAQAGGRSLSLAGVAAIHAQATSRAGQQADAMLPDHVRHVFELESLSTLADWLQLPAEQVTRDVISSLWAGEFDKAYKRAMREMRSSPRVARFELDGVGRRGWAVAYAVLMANSEVRCVVHPALEQLLRGMIARRLRSIEADEGVNAEKISQWMHEHPDMDGSKLMAQIDSRRQEQQSP